MLCIMGRFLRLGVLGQEGILWRKDPGCPNFLLGDKILPEAFGLGETGGGSLASSLYTKAAQIWRGLFSASERSLNRCF